MRWTDHTTRLGDTKNACNILIGKPEWKGPHWRSRCRWEDSVKWILMYGCEDVDW